MFKLELLNLVNEYKYSDEYKKKNIAQSIKALVNQNKEEYENLVQDETLNDTAIEIVEKCKQEKDPEEDDFANIKKKYEEWLTYFRANNSEADENCQKVVIELVTFYAPNRYHILKKLIELKENDEFEKFKNMLQNYLRVYFAEKVEKYYSSSDFIEKGFFAKRSKRKHIIKLLDEIGRYEFNPKKIEEVLK